MVRLDFGSVGSGYYKISELLLEEMEVRDGRSGCPTVVVSVPNHPVTGTVSREPSTRVVLKESPTISESKT